jgi:hypothetical protein
MGWWDIVSEWHNANEAKFNFQFSLPSITINDFLYFSHINFSMPASALWPFFYIFYLILSLLMSLLLFPQFFCFFTDWLKRINFPCLPYSRLKQDKKNNSEIFQIMNDSAVEYKRVRAAERSWILKDNSDLISILIVITICYFSQGSHYA